MKQNTPRGKIPARRFSLRPLSVGGTPQGPPHVAACGRMRTSAPTEEHRRKAPSSVRPRKLRIIRHGINAMAYSLRCSSSPQHDRCAGSRWGPQMATFPPGWGRLGEHILQASPLRGEAVERSETDEGANDRALGGIKIPRQGQSPCPTELQQRTQWGPHKSPATAGFVGRGGAAK